MAHPLIAGAPQEGTPGVLKSTYFDTPDQMLRSHGVGLRLRQQPAGAVQTVKSAGTSSGGLSRRLEWETPWTGAFDFSGVSDPATAALLDGVKDGLVPVFVTCFHRETRRIQIGPGAAVLVMIDTGHIEAGEETAPIHELELELAGGNEDELFRIAGTLQKDLPLTAGNVSKAQRGYRLACKRFC